MGIFTNAFSGTLYRLTAEIIGSSVDDNEVPRFRDDTHLEPGTEFRIVRGPHAWAHHPEQELYYTILVMGSEYNVSAADLEPNRTPVSPGNPLVSSR